MSKIITRLASSFLLSVFLMCSAAHADAVKGIYISQTTLENTQLIKYLVDNAKKTGINTFVVDMDIPSKLYQKNIKLVTDNNINYVARIVMFPGGGTHQQITSEQYWKRKYKLVTAAVGYGAKGIQLDYIRYNTHSGSSPEHAKNVDKIVRWYRDQLAELKIPLQIDVFGISSFGEEPHIGQNIRLLSQSVDTICPMVYPSHYTPFREHFSTPYETVYDSLVSIQNQFDKKMSAKLVPYIELSNYHYPLSRTKKIAYIQAQLKAVKDAGADGWYAWSPNNYYDVLFEVLETNPGNSNPSPQTRIETKLEPKQEPKQESKQDNKPIDAAESMFLLSEDQGMPG